VPSDLPTLTPRQRKALRSPGGIPIPGACPECGSPLARVPIHGRFDRVCVDALLPSPTCDWREPEEVPSCTR